MLEKSLYDRFYRLIFFLKQFKLQQFNIISFFLFFVQSNPNVYLDYLEYSYKSNKFFENKTNIVQLSKKWTPLISGRIFLHQRYPLIGERTVIYYCVYHTFMMIFSLVVKSQ